LRFATLCFGFDGATKQCYSTMLRRGATQQCHAPETGLSDADSFSQPAVHESETPGTLHPGIPKHYSRTVWVIARSLKMMVGIVLPEPASIAMLLENCPCELKLTI
jgi:hypothetical protein